MVACPIVLACATTLVVFAAVFAIDYRAESSYDYLTYTPPEQKYNVTTHKFEFTGKYESFDSRHEQYLKCAEVVITLSSASLIFIPGVLHYTVLPFIFTYSMVLLGLTVLCAILFMGLLSYFYEESLFAPSRFTTFRAAFVTALGFTTLLSFALAYLLLSIGIAVGVAHGHVFMKA